jgi:hypothetical protein
LTAETDPAWTYWKADDDFTFVPFTLLRYDRRTGVTERWTGTEWINTGATIAKAVYSGDLGYDEITPEEAAMIIGAQ